MARDAARVSVMGGGCAIAKLQDRYRSGEAVGIGENGQVLIAFMAAAADWSVRRGTTMLA